MFSFILYAIISFVAAFVLTMLAVVIRPLKSRDEFRPGKVMITFMIIAMLAPYLYVETISRMLNQQVKSAIEDAYAQSKIGGPMLYYKIHYYWGDNAKAYVIGHEKQSWGGFDRPIIDVKLVKGPRGWKAASYEFIQSDQRNEDHVTYPPYW